MSKRDDELESHARKAFLSKSRALAYIEETRAQEPGTIFDIDVVNFEDIEEMKVWRIFTCKAGYEDMIFYEKPLAECAPKMMDYPKDTKIKEYVLKGPKFMDEYLEEHGLTFYAHYQVLFNEDGEVDTSNPKSNTVEPYYTDLIGILIGVPTIRNDNPDHLWVDVYYTLKDPIHKDELLERCKKARTDYIHEKYHLEY